MLTLGLIVAMAVIYAVIEIDSKGEAFAAMLPHQISSQDCSASRETYESEPFQLEVDALYFSTVTAATVGYGEIRPVWKSAKIAVVFQILASQLFLIVILGVVVGSLK